MSDILTILRTKIANADAKLLHTDDEVYLHAIDEIQKLRTALNASNEWIPVSDRLPDDAKEVLIYYRHDDGSHNIDTDQYGELGWSFYRDENVTHWMPLPAPPKEE